MFRVTVQDTFTFSTARVIGRPPVGPPTRLAAAIHSAPGRTGTHAAAASSAVTSTIAAPRNCWPTGLSHRRTTTRRLSCPSHGASRHANCVQVPPIIEQDQLCFGELQRRHVYRATLDGVGR